MAILCGTDFSDDAKRAARASVGLAGPLGDEVILVHAMELPQVAFLAGEGMILPPAVPPPNTEALERELRERLEADARALGNRVKPVLTIGAPELALVDEVRRFGARLLVVGSHGASGAARWLLGSTADRLVRSSPVPVVVIRGDAQHFMDWTTRRRPMKVLVCVDFEDAADAVASAALAICRGGELACEIHFAHSFEAPSPFAIKGAIQHPSTQFGELELRVQDELERIASRNAVPSERIHLLRGKPASAIAKLAKDEGFDLIVAGTHSRHGLERLLVGSVATGLLHRAPCPVVVAPIGPEAVQPTDEPRAMF